MKTNTKQQQRAIDSDFPAIAVIAGPGSGKTATTVARIKRLVGAGKDPRRMVVMTFTTKAAREIEERLAIAGDDRRPGHYIKVGFIGTLHAFALRCLKTYGLHIGYGSRLSIIDNAAATELMASKAQTLGIKTKIDKLMAVKSRGIPQTVTETGERKRLTTEETCVLSYYSDLREAGMVDFDSMLFEFWRLIGGGYLNGVFDYLFDDETQDHSLADWLVLNELPIPNKFFVGDPDQAIYGFRGGRVDLFVNYAKQPGVEMIELGANFRCRQVICTAANTMIEHNTGRIEKLTTPTQSGGTVEVVPAAANPGEEIAKVMNALRKYFASGEENLIGSVAILGRTNDIVSSFRRHIEPLAEHFHYTRPPIVSTPRDWKIAKALVELLVNPENDTLAFFYLLQRDQSSDSSRLAHLARRTAAEGHCSINLNYLGLPSFVDLTRLPQVMERTGITKESCLQVAELIRMLPDDSDLVDLVLQMNSFREVEKPEQKPGPSLIIDTIHGAKGREFDIVFLVGFEDGICPGTRKDTNVEEERRLAFVGLTRARSAVYITHCESRETSWGQIVGCELSRFAREMGVGA